MREPGRPDPPAGRASARPRLAPGLEVHHQPGPAAGRPRRRDQPADRGPEERRHRSHGPGAAAPWAWRRGTGRRAPSWSRSQRPAASAGRRRCSSATPARPPALPDRRRRPGRRATSWSTATQHMRKRPIGPLVRGAGARWASRRRPPPAVRRVTVHGRRRRLDGGRVRDRRGRFPANTSRPC